MSPEKICVAPGVLRRIRSVVRQIGRRENAAGIIHIQWTGDTAMRLLNKTFRRLDKTTDVLSFPMHDENIVGDIVISVEKAVRQAPRFRNSPHRELLRLAVHGVYHLLGYDHQHRAEAARMRRRERWALRA